MNCPSEQRLSPLKTKVLAVIRDRDALGDSATITTKEVCAALGYKSRRTRGGWHWSFGGTEDRIGQLMRDLEILGLVFRAGSGPYKTIAWTADPEKARRMLKEELTRDLAQLESRKQEITEALKHVP